MAAKPVPDEHSATVRLGRYGTARGTILFSARSFRDVDVSHPDGRTCVRLTFLIQGVETTQCTEVTADLFDAEIDAIRKTLSMSPTSVGSVFRSGARRG